MQISRVRVRVRSGRFTGGPNHGTIVRILFINAAPAGSFPAGAAIARVPAPRSLGSEGIGQGDRLG